MFFEKFCFGFSKIWAFSDAEAFDIDLLIWHTKIYLYGNFVIYRGARSCVRASGKQSITIFRYTKKREHARGT